MKIGFVLDDRLDKPDGVQQYVKLVASWMSIQGYEVHYLVGNSPKATEMNVHNLSRTVGVKFNKNRMAIPMPASRKEIKELLDKERFDILHIQMPYSPLLAGRVISAAGPNTAVIGTFHILPHGKVSSVGTRLLSAVLARSKKRFDGFISVSPAAQQFAESHFGITSAVLPNVVNLKSYKKGKPLARFSDKKNIIFLGRLVERKGAPYLLKAYEKLLISTPDAVQRTRLIICGDGEERQKLEQEAERIRSETNAEIVFTGFLDENDKPDYLASATLAVYPATGGESFGIVLIEAMAAQSGVVIAGNNPGYSSVFSEIPDVLVAPKDTNNFADLLCRAIYEPDFALSIHPRQQALVKKFDITVVGPKLETYYKQALAKRNQKRDTN